MFNIMKQPVILGAILMSALMALAQTQVPRETLSVQGYQGQATIIRNHGRVFVDVQDLARITKGSLSFEEGRNHPDTRSERRFRSDPRQRHKVWLFTRVHESCNRGHGLDKRMGRDAAGDRSKWIPRGEGHGRKYGSCVPGPSSRQRRISLSRRIDG